VKVRRLPAPRAGATPSRSRRDRQRLETRDRLFEAALTEFRQVGLARAQIDRIVDRVGVTRGTFYFHFPTKEHVLFELQKRLEGRIIERFGSVPEGADSLRQFLLRVADACADVGAALADPTLARELIAIYVRERRVVDLSGQPLVVAIVDRFAEAAERGEVRPDLAPEEAAGVFLNALFGFVATDPDGLVERRPDFERIVDVIVRGIAP
jgi:AcrR family transcriptional regulator